MAEYEITVFQRKTKKSGKDGLFQTVTKKALGIYPEPFLSTPQYEDIISCS